MQRYLNNLLHNVVVIFKTYLSLDKPVHLIEIEKKKQKNKTTTTTTKSKNNNSKKAAII